jgi:16S rRNA (guanine(527)-N(7))-methyltransferase RsmG
VTTIEFRDRLARRTRRAKAPLTLGMLEPLEAYFRLLAHWNAKINLTSLPLAPPTDEAFDRLLVEPLAASRQIPTGASGVWVDIGSGGGSPAIPLKIARPALKLTMIESKERKGAFLREVVRVLELPDALVETERFETFADAREHLASANFATARAVRIDAEFFQTAGRIVKNGGQLFLFRPAHSPSPDPLDWKRIDTFSLIDAPPPSFVTIYQRMFHVEQR